jgi:4-alpha-glucanotransferase
VAPFAAEHADRVAFHAWLQWLVDGELAAAGSEIDIVHDLAIGVDPAGADAWWWQDAFALGMRVGAPPDEFNPAGQDWGLPPLDPWRLRQAAYEPFIRTVRAGLRHAGGLRVDHVMGLFRLFWIPEGAGPAQGAYVRYPWRELLGILALESVRAGAFVVGEDLGTVEPWVREELAARGVLSYRLLWFEDGPPEDYPAQALAAVTTHDLPTVAGVWKGTDPGDGVDTLRERLVRLVDLPPEASTAQVVAAAYARLALAPSAVVVATVEDALEVEQRPNMPGTTEASNWSTPLPCSLEDIEADPRVAAVAEAMGGRTAEQEPA